jgi:hypothetical protein
LGVSSSEGSDVSGLETAIRNALSRSERGNPETRARIYQSARNALEAGLRKQEINDPETVAAQRHRLEATIHQIETEEREALRAEVALVTRAEPVAPSIAERAALEPVLRAERETPTARTAGGMANAGRADPVGEVRSEHRDLGGIRPERDDRLAKPSIPVDTTGAASEPSDFRPERVVKARKRRGRFFSFLLVVATLVAGIGTAVWWVESSGLLNPARNGSDLSSPPATVSGDDFSGEDPLKKALDTQSRFSSDWREVFGPGEMANLSAGSAGRLESVTTNEGPAARVTSTSAERDGAISIKVESAVLGEMSGKTSTIALTLQSVSGKPVQVAVECEFATLGTCGRHRFTVSERTDVLFQVEFDRSLSPSGAGQLILNSDMGGGGQSVNLFAARILPGE